MNHPEDWLLVGMLYWVDRNVIEAVGTTRQKQGLEAALS